MSEPTSMPERVMVECALDEAPDKVWRALSIPEFRDSWAEDEHDKELDERAPLTREQVQALREEYPLLSPWRVVAVQAAVGLVVAVLAAVITGRGAIGWSALYGAAAVVVPGARQVAHGWGREQGLSLQTPVIVKYRDDKTDLATALEGWLR